MRAWTGPEERKLINILKKFSIKACAEILNRSGPSISRKANRLGWKGKPKGPSKAFYAEDIADMLELAEIGFSHSLIAASFNSTRGSISSTLTMARKFGFEKYPKRPVIY